MTTYSLSDRLPDLPLNPPEPNTECNLCGHLFNLRATKFSDPDDIDDFCPKCGSEDIHKI